MQCTWIWLWIVFRSLLDWDPPEVYSCSSHPLLDYAAIRKHHNKSQSLHALAWIANGWSSIKWCALSRVPNVATFVLSIRYVMDNNHRSIIGQGHCGWCANSSTTQVGANLRLQVQSKRKTTFVECVCVNKYMWQKHVFLFLSLCTNTLWFISKRIMTRLWWKLVSQFFSFTALEVCANLFIFFFCTGFNRGNHVLGRFAKKLEGNFGMCCKLAIIICSDNNSHHNLLLYL